MYNLDLEKGKYPIILKPNLGTPILINLRDYKNEKGEITKKVGFKAYVITVPKMSITKILEYFLSIYIQPILKDDGDFAKRRGNKYQIHALQINRIEEIDCANVLTEENCVSYDMFKGLLQVDDVFGKRKDIYTIQFEIRDIKNINDDLIIKGNNKLTGAVIDSYGDHRTVMCMAVAGLLSEGDTIIKNSDCIDKSFPDFMKILKSITKLT